MTGAAFPLLAALIVLSVAWAVVRLSALRRLRAGFSRGIASPGQGSSGASPRTGVRAGPAAGAALGRMDTGPSGAGALGSGLRHRALLASRTLATPLMASRPTASRRQDSIERQLPDVLALQAAALRAGHSIAGSLEAAGREAPPPVGPELVRCAAEIAVGVPLEDALAGLVRRCGTRTVEPWAAALLAGQATGGNLPRALTSLAERARDRAQLRSELRALTAQGRLSGTVVSLAPVAFLALMTAASGEEARAFYGTGAGLVVLGAGALLDAAGLLWIRRIVGIRL